MTETIILAPGANGTELLRTLAYHGVNTFGVRVMNAVELAEYALMKKGTAVRESYIPRREEAGIYSEFLDSGRTDYFKINSYSDAENLAYAVDSLRQLIVADEAALMAEKLSGGDFPEKNKAVLSAYEYYTEKLAGENRIDSIGIIRKAIDCGCSFSADFVSLREYRLSPLEKELLNVVSCGKAGEPSSILSFAGKESKPLHIEKYVRAYGASNEVEYIIDSIMKNNIPLDSCTIAVADTAQYSQLFLDICRLYKIPVTFGCGIPVSDSRPAEIMKLLNIWNTSGFNGVDSLHNLIYSASFDRNKLYEKSGGKKINPEMIIRAAGRLRISFDGVVNSERIRGYETTADCKELGEDNLACLRILASEFEKGPAYIISEYTAVRKNEPAVIDRAAIRTITESINVYLGSKEGSDISEIVPKILKKSVCAENSRGGCLFVTGLGSAVCSLRKNLFVAGLSSTNFPGKPRENYLVLDSDYALFTNEETVGSEKKINDRIDSLRYLAETAASFDNIITFSWSGFNLAEIKEANPSSVLFGYYDKGHGGNSTYDDFDKSVKKVGFFETGLSVDGRIGAGYKNGNSIAKEKKAPAKIQGKTAEAVPYTGKKVFSPSKIDDYCQCPRRFFLAHVLGIKKDNEDNPLDVIAANDFGTIVHAMMEFKAKMMEFKANRIISREEFLKFGNEKFDEFLRTRPAVNESDIEPERREYLDCLENAYKSDQNNPVFSAEGELECEHSSGITLKGRYDRLEAKGFDNIVVDYKTGRNLKHHENDYDSCIQTLLYAYMIGERYNKIVHKCEYRYVRIGKTVCCKYDRDAAAHVDNLLNEIAGNLDETEFVRKRGKNNENCRYCSFKTICGSDEAEVKADE